MTGRIRRHSPQWLKRLWLAEKPPTHKEMLSPPPAPPITDEMRQEIERFQRERLELEQQELKWQELARQEREAEGEAE